MDNKTKYFIFNTGESKLLEKINTIVSEEENFVSKSDVVFSQELLNLSKEKKISIEREIKGNFSFIKKCEEDDFSISYHFFSNDGILRNSVVYDCEFKNKKGVILFMVDCGLENLIESIIFG